MLATAFYVMFVITVITGNRDTGLKYETLLDGPTQEVKTYSDLDNGPAECRDFANLMDLVNKQENMWGKEWIGAYCHPQDEDPPNFELWAYWKDDNMPPYFRAGTFVERKDCQQAAAKMHKKDADPEKLIRHVRCLKIEDYLKNVRP